MRRLLTGLLAGTLLLSATPALAQDTAVEVNTKDGSSVFDVTFMIRRAAGDVVDTTNAAAAVASCEECQTVAVAIQVVLVTGDPEVVSPENLALAMNIECTLCSTLASAYQIVLGTGGQVHFTAEGNKLIAELRRRLIELSKSDASIAEIQAAVAAIVADLKAVLATELVPAGPPAPDAPSSSSATPDAPSGETSSSPSPAPEPSDSAAPSEPAEASPTSTP